MPLWHAPYCRHVFDKERHGPRYESWQGAGLVSTGGSAVAVRVHRYRACDANLTGNAWRCSGPNFRGSATGGDSATPADSVTDGGSAPDGDCATGECS